MKIARYALDNWADLRDYTPMETIRYDLKTLNRQFQLASKQKTATSNNLIALLEQSFPGVRKDSLNAFTERYRKWCKRHGYCFKQESASKVYALAVYGVGESLGPQLMAEIGDVRRFERKQSLVAFAGVDPIPNQSGEKNVRSNKASKRGSPYLRKTLFSIMMCLLQTTPANEPVFQFLDRKRAEGKPYYVYMTAGMNKFLRRYYAKVRDYLASLEASD